MKRIAVVDSHTAGEPTRVVVAGGPELGGDSVAHKLKAFREQHDRFRRAVVNEPRGSEVLVGALLVEPGDRSCVTGVIYFDNVTFLGMCGHGTIGLVVTLAHLGRIRPGEHRIETPVGVVTAVLHEDRSVSVTNIPAYRKARGVALEVAGCGQVTGDVAWGGNWFFLTRQHGLDLALPQVERLTTVAWQTRLAANAQGFPEVDHVVLLGPPRSEGAQAQDFVLCPGKAYDRSPCGTGLSAQLACLAADGRLAEDQPYVLESILRTPFTGRYRWQDRAAGAILPTITGTAHVTAETEWILNPSDPFCWGIP